MVIFLYVPLLQFATIHRGERDENWSNKEVLIALLWATSLSRARPSTETIAILSRHVVHCTIIKYDDAALLFKYLSMATIGERPISDLLPFSSPSREIECHEKIDETSYAAARWVSWRDPRWSLFRQHYK